VLFEAPSWYPTDGRSLAYVGTENLDGDEW
jgi:hypothetical protein